MSRLRPVMPWFRMAPVGGSIADCGVGTSQLADCSVTSAKIADSGVTSGDIQDSAVTTAKLNDGGVTAAKLNSTTGTGAVVLASAPTLVNPLVNNTLQAVTGQNLFLYASDAGAGEDGYDATVLASNGSAGNQSGGIVHLQAGAKTGAGTNGYVEMHLGAAGSQARFILDNLTANRNITFPDAAGTMTLLGNTSTGSGSVVLATSPTLVTPALGAATATSINGLTITSSTGTLTVTNGKTLSAAKTLTLDGTDGTTMTFPSTSASIARTDAGQTFTGVQVMTSPSITTSLTTGSSTFDLLPATATTVNFAGASSAVVNLGGGANAAELRFLEPSGSGTNYSAIKAQAQGANITYTLPATVASAGQVLTDAAGNGTLSWATPASGSVPTMTRNYGFETAGRYGTATGGGATATWGSVGVLLDTTATSGRYYSIKVTNNAAKEIFARNATWSGSLIISALPGSDNPQLYFGAGSPTVDGTGHTFTNDHYGFKIVRVAGAQNLYATIADGTTEQVSSILTTVAADDVLMLVAVLTAGTSVAFYWSKNYGAWSSATTLSTNPPRTTATDADLAQFSVSNASTAAAIAAFGENMTMQWPTS